MSFKSNTYLGRASRTVAKTAGFAALVSSMAAPSFAWVGQAHAHQPHKVQYTKGPNSHTTSVRYWIKEINRRVHNGFLNLSFMQINQADIHAISKALRGRSDIVSINLRGNAFGKLPTDFTHGMMNLRVMNLENCNLRELPEGFGANLPILEELRLSENQIAQLPRTFNTHFQSLRAIDLSHNRLGSLPKRFGSNMRYLHTLDLTGNTNLMHLPRRFGEGMMSLHNIYMAGTDLRYLPRDFAQVGQLQSLMLPNSIKFDRRSVPLQLHHAVRYA